MPSGQSNRLTAHGVPAKPDDDDKRPNIGVRLTEALRYVNAQKQTRDIPASTIKAVTETPSTIRVSCHE